MFVDAWEMPIYMQVRVDIVVRTRDEARAGVYGKEFSFYLLVWLA